MRCDKRRTVLLEWLMGMWVRLQTVKGNQPCRSIVFRDFVRVMTMTRRRDSSSFFFYYFVLSSSCLTVCLTNPINNPGQLFVFHVWRVCGPGTFEISMNFKLKLSGYEIGGKQGDSGGYWYVRWFRATSLSASISNSAIHSRHQIFNLV